MSSPVPKPSREGLLLWAEQITNLLEELTAPKQPEVPVGTIVAYASDQLPDGWLECDGGEYLLADFPALGTYLGDLWDEGVPPAAGYFKVPNLEDRVLLGGAAAAVGTIADTLGGAGVDTATILYLIKA